MPPPPPPRSSPIPARPLSSPPPRRSSQPPISSVRPRHEDLQGADGTAVRFRPARLNAADVPADLACRFRCDGTLIGPLAMLDLSTNGFAAATPPQWVLPPGSVLDSFELRLGDRPIWTGEAVAVHASGGRVGGRFTSGVLDLEHLRLGATLEGRLAIHREERLRLPSEWRAAIGDLRQLLEDARFELEEIERAEVHDPLRRNEEEAQLFEGLRASWGAAFYGTLTKLHEMSKGLDPRSAVLGQGYASSMLMPLLAACPMHRRAYEKPLGYAGDYRMMELYFAENIGEGLFGRFLYSVTKRYTLVRAVIAREVLLRHAVRATAETEGEGAVRVLALAAGPAMELRRFLEETGPLRRPVELILLDQDRGAHESAHRHLTRILLERHHGMLPVTVRCLQFSVRQLLKPQTPEDERVVHETLADLDLVYSGGLYDYLPDSVAARLTQLTYSLLRQGGRLLHGNLIETPDTTWVMDYVLGWPLVYRTDQTMLGLATALQPCPASVEIARDSTGAAIFLDVTKSAPV